MDVVKTEEYQCRVKKGGQVYLRDLPPMTLFTSFDTLFLKLGDLSEVYGWFENKQYKPTGVVNVKTGKVVFHSDDCTVIPYRSTLTY